MAMLFVVGCGFPAALCLSHLFEAYEVIALLVLYASLAFMVKPYRKTYIRASPTDQEDADGLNASIGIRLSVLAGMDLVYFACLNVRDQLHKAVQVSRWSENPQWMVSSVPVQCLNGCIYCMPLCAKAWAKIIYPHHPQ